MGREDGMDPRKQRCPYRGCKNSWRAGAGNVRRFGATSRGRQRFQCATCGRTFCETSGSVFYRLRSERECVLAALRWWAQGYGVLSIARRLHVKKSQTVSGWLLKAFSAPRKDDFFLEEWGLTPQQMNDLRDQFFRWLAQGSAPRRRSVCVGQGCSAQYSRQGEMCVMTLVEGSAPM